MKPLRASISLMTLNNQYKKKTLLTVTIPESKNVLLSFPSIKVTSEDLSKLETPIWEVSAKQKRPQYTVIIPVANESASKSNSGSLMKGLFLAVSTRKSTKTRSVMRAYVSAPKLVTNIQTAINISFLIVIIISQKQKSALNPPYINPQVS